MRSFSCQKLHLSSLCLVSLKKRKESVDRVSEDDSEHAGARHSGTSNEAAHLSARLIFSEQMFFLLLTNSSVPFVEFIRPDDVSGLSLRFSLVSLANERNGDFTNLTFFLQT